MAVRARAQTAQRRHRRERGLSVRRALALGLIQGPAEALPVSSSGHLVLVPALLGWDWERLPADVRKTFEVALHAGGGLALAWLLRDEARAALRDPAGTALLAAPAALAGVALERPLEERLSNPRIAAWAQIAAGTALAAADSPRNPRKGDRPFSDSPRNPRKGDRPVSEGPRNPRKGDRPFSEGFVGAAQALALVPGISRNGATLTAARALGMPRAEAARVSWRAGLPVIAGATALKAARLARRGLPPEQRAPFAAGAAAAFASTLAAAPLLRWTRGRPYAPLAAYRVALGALALRRLHRLEWPRG